MPRPFAEIPGPRRWPLIGSLLDFHSRWGDERTFKIARDYYEEFGTVVRVQLPGQGPEVWVYDPHEMLKLFLAEGKYPDGPIRLTWPLVEWTKRRGTNYPLMEVGEKWRQHRAKLNPGIFNVQTAATYIPPLNETARDLSSHFPAHASDLIKFCQLASFDLFCTAVIGKNLRVIDEASADPRDVAFAKEAANAFHLMGDLMFSPLESLLKGKVDTKTYKAYERSMDIQMERSREIVDNIMADVEKMNHSYLKLLVDSGKMNEAEAASEVVTLLGAAVDTTATTLLWFIYDLARNPEAQRKAAAELHTELKGKDFDRSAYVPYFKACYRESLRLSPIGNTGTFRTTPVDLVLGGYTVPQGCRVNTIGAAMLFDPKFVDHPDSYQPERWLEDAVAARKGTEREIIDHKLLAANFGFGPRMCLGARLAVNEIYTMVARLLLDWEIEVARPHDRVVLRLLRAPDPTPQLALRPRTF